MSEHQHEDHAAHDDEHLHEGEDAVATDADTTLMTVAAVGAVGIGALVFEAALLPGVALGVAAMAAPKLMPRLGSAMHPLFRSAVRGAYKMGQKTREFVAETQERVEDIVAEVDAEVSKDGVEAKDGAAKV